MLVAPHPGQALLQGGSGDDKVLGGGGPDRLVGGEGNDRLYAFDTEPDGDTGHDSAEVDRTIGVLHVAQLEGAGGQRRRHPLQERDAMQRVAAPVRQGMSHDRVDLLGRGARHVQSERPQGLGQLRAEGPAVDEVVIVQCGRWSDPEGRPVRPVGRGTGIVVHHRLGLELAAGPGEQRLDAVPVEQCHQMRADLDALWDPDKGEPRRPFSQFIAYCIES